MQLKMSHTRWWPFGSHINVFLNAKRRDIYMAALSQATWLTCGKINDPKTNSVGATDDCVKPLSFKELSFESRKLYRLDKMNDHKTQRLLSIN